LAALCLLSTSERVPSERRPAESARPTHLVVRVAGDWSLDQRCHRRGGAAQRGRPIVAWVGLGGSRGGHSGYTDIRKALVLLTLTFKLQTSDFFSEAQMSFPGRATLLGYAVFGAVLMLSSLAWANGQEFFEAPAGNVDLGYTGRVRDINGRFLP